MFFVIQTKSKCRQRSELPAPPRKASRLATRSCCIATLLNLVHVPHLVTLTQNFFRLPEVTKINGTALPWSASSQTYYENFNQRPRPHNLMLPSPSLQHSNLGFRGLSLRFRFWRTQQKMRKKHLPRILLPDMFSVIFCECYSLKFLNLLRP